MHGQAATELPETTHAPACPEAMREAAKLFESLRTRAAFIGGALFAQWDSEES